MNFRLNFRLSIIILALYVGFTTTAVVYSQTPLLSSHSQETINALVDERIARIEHRGDDQDRQITAAVSEMAAMRSSMDRFTGIGIGIGAVLTVLQALSVLTTAFAFRRKNEDRA